ncbi:hypothetical protein D3C87_1995020 [compost metagenome]
MVLGAVAPVTRAGGRGDERLHRVALELTRPVPEHPLGLLIAPEDGPLRIDDQGGVRGGLEEGLPGEASKSFAQRVIFRLLDHFEAPFRAAIAEDGPA